jgi:hypothetical protein
VRFSGDEDPYAIASLSLFDINDGERVRAPFEYVALFESGTSISSDDFSFGLKAPSSSFELSNMSMRL